MLGYPVADTTITTQLSGIALFWGELDKFSLFSVPFIRVDHNDLGPFRGSPMNISNLRNPDPDLHFGEKSQFRGPISSLAIL
jgi:hypothetical protein